MKTYRTAGSDEGLRLPHSGIIVGRIADALRLKDGLRDALGDSGYKTAQRYFGGARVEPDAVDAILDSLVYALVPAGLALPTCAGVTESLQTFIAGGLKFYARMWDRIVAEMNSLCYPVSAQRDLPIPVLRLLVLDVGLRWGAWANLQVLRGEKANLLPWWIDDAAIANLIDRWRAQRGGLSREALAASVGVTVQAMAGWRSGEALPTNAHIEAIAGALSAGPTDRQVNEYLLRLVVGVRSLHRDLTNICGRERIDDMMGAMARTAQIVHETFVIARTGMNENAIAPQLWNAVFYGARCPMGAALADMLASKAAFRQDVSADFTALRGDWAERAQYWMKFLGTVPDAIENLRCFNAEKEMFAEKDVERVGTGIVEERLRMSDFDWAPPTGWKTYSVSMPPEMKAANCAEAAQRALSLNDFDEALKHLRQALKHSPLNAALHFYLGAVLGTHGLRSADLAMMEESVMECRLAYQMDPEFGNARNEVGIILANMRRHAEAEVAYAEAEAHYGHHAHHWFCRGSNYLALERLDLARLAFEKAIKLTKDGMHVEAMARLAATLMKLGRDGEGRRLGRKVHHLVGMDPSLDVDAVLDVWKGNPFPCSGPACGK